MKWPFQREWELTFVMRSGATVSCRTKEWQIERDGPTLSNVVLQKQAFASQVAFVDLRDVVGLHAKRKWRFTWMMQ